MCVLVIQLVANMLLFTSVNLSGLFVRILTERAQRKAFLQARNCIEERLRMEDENEKQVTVLMSNQHQHDGCAMCCCHSVLLLHVILYLFLMIYLIYTFFPF